jgi:pheromone shutdown protein TraB
MQVYLGDRNVFTTLSRLSSQPWIPASHHMTWRERVTVATALLLDRRDWLADALETQALRVRALRSTSDNDVVDAADPEAVARRAVALAVGDAMEAAWLRTLRRGGVDMDDDSCRDIRASMNAATLVDGGELPSRHARTVLVRERDYLLCHGIWTVAQQLDRQRQEEQQQQHQHPQQHWPQHHGQQLEHGAAPPCTVVAVVGMAHLPGMRRLWGTTSDDVAASMCQPLSCTVGVEPLTLPCVAVGSATSVLLAAVAWRRAPRAARRACGVTVAAGVSACSLAAWRAAGVVSDLRKSFSDAKRRLDGKPPHVL